jgi:hypothetical protein
MRVQDQGHVTHMRRRFAGQVSGAEELKFELVLSGSQRAGFEAGLVASAVMAQ